MKTVTIYTDGSSKGNPGPGGWGTICVYPKASGEMRVDELGGREDHTTNNRMELMSAIMGLKHFDDFYSKEEKVEFVVTSDSSYVVNGMKSWIFGWQKNNWKNSQKKDVLNRDLWEMLIEAAKNKKMEWKQVKGHSGHIENERCDVIATSFADNEPVELFKGGLVGYEENFRTS